MAQEYRMEKYREQIINSIVELVKIKSVKEPSITGKPFGEGCDAVLVKALAIADELGLTTKNVDGYAGHAEYGSGDEIVGVLNHLDVVPESTGWTFPPYGGTIQDGKIYARGTSDNKGPAVVSLYCLKAMKDLNIPVKRRVRVILGIDEESGWEDMKYYLEREQLPSYGFSPDAGYPMYNCEKGILVLNFNTAGEHDTAIVSIHGGNARNMVPDSCRAVVDLEKIPRSDDFLIWAEQTGAVVVSQQGKLVTLETKGVSAHGANPSGGDNAIAHMLKSLQPLYISKKDNLSEFMKFACDKIGFEFDGESLGIKGKDEPSGDLTLNMGILNFEAGKAEVITDIRFPVTHKMETILESAKNIAGQFEISVEVEKYTAPLYVPADSPLIKVLAQAYEMYTGEKAEPMSMGGGTYARVLNNNGVAFGPGFPGGENTKVHQPDEFCVIDDLMRHAEICLQAMIDLANI